MRFVMIFLLAAALLVGCGRARLAGDYRAEIRLMEGRQESTDRGYSLAEVQARAAQDQRSLTLESNGRYALRSGDIVNEGKWRVEDDALILRDDRQNGIAIQPALQKDRRWRLRAGGEILNDSSYSYYGYEEVYVPG